jgi:glycosyltransferase involved in cell wall biosynthesis
MPSPAVTVLIPTYNWSTVLPYSVGSVLWQTFTDFELLVVGDGCTDESEAVVRSVADPRVRWVNLPANTGHQTGPNNEGLRQARGEVVAYLGHDDLWLPHHLECMLGGLATGADLAYAVTASVNVEGGPPVAPVVVGPYRPGTWMPPTGVAHRRLLTEQVGGWRDHRELRCNPESELWERLYRAGRGFRFVHRLTAIKFPASRRAGVYRRRPNHEQAAWFERIKTTPAIEAMMLVMMLAGERQARQSRPGESDGPTEQWEPGEQVHARRAFKGLEPAP